MFAHRNTMEFIPIGFAIKFIYFAISLWKSLDFSLSVPSVLRGTIQFEAVKLNFQNDSPKWKWLFYCMDRVHRVKFVCFHIKIFQSKMHNDDLSTNTHLCVFCILCVWVRDWWISLYCNDPYLHNTQHTNARDVQNKCENWKERKTSCESERVRVKQRYL